MRERVAAGSVAPARAGMSHGEIVSFIWGVADLIRDTFKRGKYQDVILPLTVLRRLDCVLAPTKERVLAKQAELRGKKLENLDPQLRRASGFAFYNTSRYDFDKLLADAPHVAANLRNHIAGFSQNMREVIERFDFDNTITKLDDAGLLFQVLERFRSVDLHPDRIDNATMGTIFEELIRKFNEALDENPGEHFTPRDVVHLMVDLMLAGDHERMFIKEPTGRDADNIAFGSTLSNDGHSEKRFDYLIANPPYGKDWKRDEDTVRAEHERGTAGRFGPGLPRVSDGQLLFLMHMLARAKEGKDGGSRVAIIMNGSPLFTGDAGSGESEIRRSVLENDLLEAIVALPEELFYNTGIATYVWSVTNRKPAARREKVQLIDATSFWVATRRSLGDKRRVIPPERAQDILRILADFKDGDTRIVRKDGIEEEVVVSKIFPTTHFGFRKITVERPLRLNFQASPERTPRVEEDRVFKALGQSKKKGAAGSKEQLAGRAKQDAIRGVLRAIGATRYKDEEEFREALEANARKASVTISGPVMRSLLLALSEPDETAEIVRDGDGNPEPDPALRDTEAVPLSEDVDTFFEREVRPHVPEAWIDPDRRDEKDGEVGLVGYEINFNRHFYRYKPPRALGEIDEDIRAVEKDIVRLLAEITGTRPEEVLQ